MNVCNLIDQTQQKMLKQTNKHLYYAMEPFSGHKSIDL